MVSKGIGYKLIGRSNAVVKLQELTLRDDQRWI